MSDFEAVAAGAGRKAPEFRHVCVCVCVCVCVKRAQATGNTTKMCVRVRVCGLRTLKLLYAMATQYTHMSSRCVTHRP